jgi:hypothetical protein
MSDQTHHSSLDSQRIGLHNEGGQVRSLSGQLILAVPTPTTQSPADTTGTASARFIHYHHRGPRIVGVVIWLAVVIYVLWLATRVVRAIEKLADKFQSRA